MVAEAARRSKKIVEAGGGQADAQVDRGAQGELNREKLKDGGCLCQSSWGLRLRGGRLRSPIERKSRIDLGP